MGDGERKLLHFSAAVRNVGDADLLFGSSSGPAYTPAACDGQAYFAHFLSYSLVDSEGGIQATGYRQARCKAEPGFASGFDCQFNGIERGSAQLYPARPSSVLLDNATLSGGLIYTETGQVSFPSDEVCQGIDVTDVAPGNYLLRIQVNAEGLLSESRLDNNRVDIPVTLPAFDDPTQACPAGDDTWLLGYAEGRECGWAAAVPTVSCTPGASVTVGCAACTGGPLLRVCDGARACLASFALPTSSPDYRDLNCPEATFVCPPSGAYTVYQAPSGRSAAPVTCTLQTTP